MTDAQNSTTLMVRSRSWICALSAKFVLEVMRRQPIEPVMGAPPFILGMSVVRGEVTPVISLGILLGSSERVLPERFVLVRVADRRAVLGVDEVLGMDIIDQRNLDDAPGLLSEVLPRDVTRIGVLDRSVLVMLEAGRLLSEETWRALAALNAGVQ
jgi:purine-binding chemotaxis protein CheW